ncbi:hypothetical protein [Kibdelosporangium philippinense]
MKVAEITSMVANMFNRVPAPTKTEPAPASSAPPSSPPPTAIPCVD